MNENLRRKLLENKISSYRLSKVSGVPYTTISELLTGKKDINRRPVETVLRLSRALACPLEDILNPVYIMDGVSGRYRGVKYRWEREKDHMVLRVRTRSGEHTIRTQYQFCSPHKKEDYMDATEVYIDLFLQDALNEKLLAEYS